MSDFNPDGPHGPDLTREAGNELGDLVRFLDHATMGSAPGLEYPADAYALLGNWAHAAGMMPQLAEHAAAFLAGQGTRGGLYDARGADPGERIAAAQAALDRAASAAWALCRALQDAQNAIAGVG
ncbi:MAG: hypothetical protein M3Y33_08540, partial [Actinomycetota bacterium]|nr:hypothetical protein [Actinomycetota bacterium]